MADKKVLIIDDDANVRLMLQEAFSRKGFEVHAASDGNRGVASAHRIRPDLIFLDINLPGISGMSVFERLQLEERTGGIPVFFMTGEAFEWAQGKVPQSKTVRLFQKPFNMDEVVDGAIALTGAPNVPEAPKPAPPPRTAGGIEITSAAAAIEDSLRDAPAVGLNPVPAEEKKEPEIQLRKTETKEEVAAPETAPTEPEKPKIDFDPTGLIAFDPGSFQEVQTLEEPVLVAEAAGGWIYLMGRIRLFMKEGQVEITSQARLFCYQLPLEKMRWVRFSIEPRPQIEILGSGGEMLIAFLSNSVSGEASLRALIERWGTPA